MILRCTAPRKNDRLRPCGNWLAAVPNGSRVLRVVWNPRDAAPDSVVVGCDRCHTLHEIGIPLRPAA